MARWKLACPHYINTVKAAKWRYSHQDRASGELVEKEFIVPRLLDPADPKCWTNRSTLGTPVAQGGNIEDAEGEIIVCHAGKGLRGDIEIVGDPTPDMVPQDEEAQAISDSFQTLWSYKPDNPDVNYSQAVVDRHSTPSSAIEIPGLVDLAQAIAAQSALLSQIIESGAHKPGGSGFHLKG